MKEVKIIKIKIKIKQLGCAATAQPVSPNTRAGVQPSSWESEPNGPLVRLWCS